MAFSPGFFETAMVTAGAVPAISTPFCAAAGPAPKVTYCSGWSGPARTSATSCRYTGRPWCTATTRLATSSRSARNSPACTGTLRPSATTVPACCTTLAACSEPISSVTVRP
jgi:hypothetical protein